MQIYKRMGICLLISLPALGDTLDGKPTGWLWYDDPLPVLEEEKKPLLEKDDSPAPPPRPQTAVEEMIANRKQYDEAMAKAILYPTMENVTKARRIHDAIISQASSFQESWTISEVIDRLGPVDKTSPGALKIKRQEDEDAVAAYLKEMSKTYGLIFVFKEDCPYCHKFVPVIMTFAKKYNFDVHGVSPDDSCFQGLTCTKNAKLVNNLNPNPKQTFPLLLLANPETGETFTVARGLLSYSALVENIKYIIKHIEKTKEELQ